ncbi:MAG: Stealth CR1 domain-containing protein [Atopobiaceae bacterium]|nr:Stealth CR1 domain-containing protein [Atopobiaceae bacterium]
MSAHDDIDFVITWVDGSDPAWQAERDRWLALEEGHPWSAWATGDQRFRDWGLLRYWFRGVEKFAPWVRKVHFVTWGHVPEWLDVDHPKLHVVRHEEFIPEEYLPTFNSNAIELNLHRIEGLSEQFVYFNDDMFLTRPARPEQFFLRGLPRDFAGLDACVPNYGRTDSKPANTAIVNEFFDKHAVLKSHPMKWFNHLYGAKVLAKTVSVLSYSAFAGMQINHLAYNLLKGTFKMVWEAAADELNCACHHHFRNQRDCNLWLMQDWQRCLGAFEPISPQLGAWLDARLMTSHDNAEKLVREITTGRWRQVSINDECTSEEDFVFWSETSRIAFDQLLPDACSFEKDRA